MEVTIGHILTGLGVVIGLVVHAGIFGHMMGKLKGKVLTELAETKKDIEGLGKRVDSQQISIKEAVTELRELFVPAIVCDANQEKWQAFVNGFLERRDMVEENNSQHHLGIMDILKELKHDMKEDRAEDRAELRAELDSIHSCLKNIQKKLVC